VQILTYSTGAAFTGKSAACAPATATNPAAEPKRRLLTIFTRKQIGRIGHRRASRDWGVNAECSPRLIHR
jgi:hypothetical protein